MSRKKSKINQALNPRNLPKNIQWMHDFDYVKKLSPDEKQWLDRFVSEYYNGKVKKGDSTALHKGTKHCPTCKGRGYEARNGGINKDQKVLCGTCKGRRMLGMRTDCYRRKNWQNFDTQSILDCRGKMDRVPDKED